MTAQTLTLTDFLLARIAEDEAVAEELRRPSAGDPWGWQPNPHPLALAYGTSRVEMTPARVLAECEAKRRIVEDYRALDSDYRVTRSRQTEARRFQALVSIGQLATAYADHPDYNPDWRP